MKSANDYARERCVKLIQMARERVKTDETLSKKYVRLARKIAQRHRVHLGNKEFCKKCGIVWVVGDTVRVRNERGQKTTLYICVCNNVRRFPYFKNINNAS